MNNWIEKVNEVVVCWNSSWKIQVYKEEHRITRRKLTPKMSLTCKIVTSFLLIFTVSTKGKLVRGSPLSPLEAPLATPKWVQESERSQPSFPRQWATSVTFLLLVGEVSENTEVIWGCLDHDINLDIPGFQMNDGVADTRWDKNKVKIAQLKQHKPPYQITDTYVILKNGTLKIIIFTF